MTFEAEEEGRPPIRIEKQKPKVVKLDQINTHQNGAEEKSGSPELDLVGYFRRLRRRWYIVLLCAVLGFLLARVYLRYATPIYGAKSMIFIKGDPESSGTAMAEGAILQELSLFPGENRVANEIHILKSRSVMEKAVAELGLDYQYIGKGRIRDKDLYNNSPIVIDTIRWSTKPRSLEFEVKMIDDYSYTLYLDEKKYNHPFGYPVIIDLDTITLIRDHSVPPTEDVIAVSYKPALAVAPTYQKELNIKVVEDYSSVLNLTIKDEVARKAADIINKVVEVYNREAIRDKNEVQKKTLEFINDRLVLLTSELNAVESRVESFKEQQQIPTEAGASVELILGEISAYDNELVTLQIKLDLLGSIENMLGSSTDTYELIPANQLLADEGGLAGQIERYNELVLNRERLLRSAGPQNPTVLMANSELKEIRQVILSSVEAVRSNLQISLRETKRKLDQLQSRIGRIPRQERQLIEIKRQQNIKESLYLYLLQKKEEAALSSAVTVANARVIDPAVRNPEPIAPKGLNIYAAFTMLGLMLPMGILFLQHYLDDRVYNDEDIKKLTNIPIAGMIGSSKSKDPIVVKSNSRSPIAEMFRMIRTNLSYLASGKDYQTIMITSSMGGDGKTFTSLNIGMSLALSGKKTVIVGMDLRKPRMLNYLMDKADHKAVGVANFLVQAAEAKDVVYQSELSPNLYYVPSGPIPPNPSELIGSPNTIEFFQYLREHFDHIIIDTAPIGLVTDSFLLSRYADVTLILVRAGSTRRAMIKMLERVRKEGKLPHPGIVVNDVRMGGTYGYGYGYGYYEDKPKRKNPLKRLLTSDSSKE